MELYRALNDFQLHKENVTLIPMHSNYKYKYALPFERLQGSKEITLFLQRNWMHTFTISIVYYFVIRLIKCRMSTRPPFALSASLLCWNASLAAFSILGCIRCGEDLFESLGNRGLYSTLCTTCHPNDVAAFWSLLFAISKVVELGDTLFIVLRKKPLIFLHYYHHVAVLIYTIHSGAENAAPGRSFIFMNYMAHSFMYSYYAVSAAGVKMPRWVAMTLTTIQTVQMLLGVAVSCAVYVLKTVYKLPCQQSIPNLYLAFIIYITFAVLFIQFFFNSYIKGSEKKKLKKVD